MVVNKLRDRYRVDLVGLQASCEANYARLMRLLPDMRSEPAARRIAVTHGDQMLGVLALEVLLTCPYTTTLQVRQEHNWKCRSITTRAWPKWSAPNMHDAFAASILTRTPRCTSQTKRPN
jgi:uncharacterized protein YqiB (DUF1249 family)